MNETASLADHAPSRFFALRTPLLSFDELLNWGANLEAPAAGDDPNRLTAALAADRARLRARLRNVVAAPLVREALFVASPDLDEHLDIWRREPDSKRGQKIERALVRYLARMAGRATPFGLCAGCSLGRLGAQTRLALGGQAGYLRHSRLDMDYLALLVDALVRDPAVRNRVTFRPNSSLYRAAGRVRYVESRQDGKERSYHLVALEPTDYLDATLNRAAVGARPEMLAQALVTCEVSFADALAYIDELIDNQILVPDLALPLTGSEPIHPLVQALGQNEATAARADILAQVRDELAALDSTGLGIAPDRYRALRQRLESLPAPIELSRLFQVDLIKPAPDLTLGAAVLAELARGVRVLERLTSRPRDDALTRFRDAFVGRYEEREVPLVEALDDDAGIGFPVGQDAAAPLLQGLRFPAEPAAGAWSARDDFLLGKLSETLLQGARELVLEAGDLEALAVKEPLPLPDAFAVTAVLAADSQAALDAGEFRVLLEGAGGPSGARLFGRFCHSDPSLQQEVQRHVRAEEALRPDCVFAEIVHLPQGRLGNISARPVLRGYEIPYLGHSGAPPAQQLPITDLQLSVRGGRLVLRSARLDREVVPRLTNAHNYIGQGFGAYQLLCLLQDQGTAAALGWDWGALRNAPFLPRVTTGRLVLARARWRLHKDELRRLGKAERNARFRAVQSLRAQRRLPRQVALADGDNTLPIDLDNVLCVDAFVHAVKEREEALLIELFPGPEQLCARGPDGRFVHELIVPFVRKSPASARNGAQGAPAGNDDVGHVFEPDGQARKHDLRPFLANALNEPAQRRFTPGSEWLYVKLYTGMAAADQVLREVIAPLRDEALGTGAADRWFFIRYSDPDWHVRLRFHGKAERLCGELLPALDAAVKPLLQDGTLWRVQLDTYEREAERYGGALGIELAEQFFQVDSQAVLELLELLDPGDQGTDERWRLALCGIHRLLTDFDFTLSERLQVLEAARASYAGEWKVDRDLEQKLSARFRKERHTLEALVLPDGPGTRPLAPGLSVLARRSVELAPFVAEIKAAAQTGGLSVPLTKLAGSFMHMHVNRLLRSQQRQQELVLYDFLKRMYSSAVARAAESRALPREFVGARRRSEVGA
jgi:thiopeptide-type bacteriocin biosynthesis protein